MPATTLVPVETCPDLFAEVEPDAEARDIVLAGWNQGTGELLWEIPLGSRMPSWAIWNDEVILGFGDGQLVGIEASTCDSWSIDAGRTSDLAITEGGTYLSLNGARIAAFSGRGTESWRWQAIDSLYRFVAENAGVAVFVDNFGEVTGIVTESGEGAFFWGGASGPIAVAVIEGFVYRSTGAELAARPVAGGTVAWTAPLADVDELHSVPGTLLALGGGELRALEPQTGEVRWTIPFDESITGPAVLDHNELHLAAPGESLSHNLWHLNAATGATIFTGSAPAGTEWFAEMDDELLLQVGSDGFVRGINMLQREVWSLPTGANGVDRFTQVETAGGPIVVTLTFSAERF